MMPHQESPRCCPAVSLIGKPTSLISLCPLGAQLGGHVEVLGVASICGGRQMYQYQCPFCQVNSTMENGQVNHSFACGKKFRVAGGRVTGRLHRHACLTCGTIIHSAKAEVRIKAKHKNYAGRTCPRESWTVIDGTAAARTMQT